MKGKGRILLFTAFLFLFALLLLWTGFYFNGLSKPSHIYGSVIDGGKEIIDSYFYPQEDLFIGDEFTLDGSVQFDLDSEYYREKASSDEDARRVVNLINNFDKMKDHFLIKQKGKEQKGYLEIEASLGEEELVQKKILVENATKYYYVNGIVKNYINDGTCNYFENINEENTTQDNTDYLYSFLFEAVKRSLKDEYFDQVERDENIFGKKHRVSVVSIRLDDRRIHSILGDSLNEIKNDEKASNLLKNMYPDYKKWKISSDKEYLGKDESISISVFTTRFLYKPLKYEIIHLKGDEKETFIYEGDSEKGTFYYLKNDQVTYQMPFEVKNKSMILQIQDAFGNNIGEAKIERDHYIQTINYSFETENKKYDFIYSSKYTDFKKDKAYKNTRKMSFKFVEDKKNHFSGDIVFQMNAENIAKIDEDLSMATLASRLEEEEKEKIDHKWEDVKARLEK